jgi:4-amino-4-deoxy-L-arabinose transferase-like glycosyltransferase
MTINRSGSRQLVPLLLGLCAIALGLIAQLCLSSGLTWAAGLLYLMAVLLAVYALRRQPVRTSLAAPANKIVAQAKSSWGTIVAIVAVLLTALALWQFGNDHPTSVAWLLHLTSLALLLVATFLWDSHANRTQERRWTRIELVLLVVILAVAVFMRLYHLNEFPFGTYYDEADNGLNAERILTQTDLPVYVESTHLPAHYLYLIAGAFELFGVSTLSMRLASVAIGLATVAAAYLAGRELLGRKMGLAAAFMLAVSRWDINWSRIAMHGVTTPLFELLSVGLLLRALRRGRWTDFALAGLSVGIGLCFYVPFRVFPVVLVLYLVHRAVVEKDFVRRSWRGLLILSIAALMAVSPVAQYALRHPDTFWERTLWVSISADTTPATRISALADSAAKHLLMFNYRGDSNPRHNLPGEPMLDPLSGALMVLGLGLCLWRWRQPHSMLLMVWLGVMLAGGIFSRSEEAPHSLRAIGSLPAAFLLAVVPLDGLSREWMRVFERRRAALGALLLLMLFGGIGYANFHAYFDLQARNAETWSAFSTGETITAQLMVEWGDSVEYYIPWDYQTSLTIPFIAGDQIKYQLLDNSSELPLQQPASKDVVLLMDDQRRNVYRDARSYYPQATLRKWGPPDGGPVVLYMVRVTPQDIAAAISH